MAILIKFACYEHVSTRFNFLDKTLSQDLYLFFTLSSFMDKCVYCLKVLLSNIYLSQTYGSTGREVLYQTNTANNDKRYSTSLPPIRTDMIVMIGSWSRRYHFQNLCIFLPLLWPTKTTWLTNDWNWVNPVHQHQSICCCHLTVICTANTLQVITIHFSRGTFTEKTISNKKQLTVNFFFMLFTSTNYTILFYVIWLP